MGRPKDSKNGTRAVLHKTCEICQSSFDVEPYRLNARFCSRACRSKGHAKELFRQSARQCKVCGASFMARPVSKKMYCSRECSSKEHGAKIRKPITKAPTKICPQCDKSFVGARQKFCSKKCSSASYERRIQLKCQICHKLYSIRAKFHDQKYCSRACRTLGIGKTESYLEKKMASGLRLFEIDATAQYPFGRYTLDFAIPNLRIAIECDGDYWHSLPESIDRDRRKDAYLANKGWHVIRLSETDINTSLTNCLARIQRVVSLRSHPS